MPAMNDAPRFLTERHRDFTTPLPSRDERRLAGRALRQVVPRRAHGAWAAAHDRPDPVEHLIATNRGRVDDLVPVRVGRMAASPFQFFRGSASAMAADLAATPSSGIVAWLCGDAHVSNFGFYASPERTLVLDLNDFDEAIPGPWEWDVKRMAASLVLAGRAGGLTDEQAREAAQWSVTAYRTFMGFLSDLPLVEVHYLTPTLGLLTEAMDSDLVGTTFDADIRAAIASASAKAQTRTSDQALRRLAVRGDDEGYRFIEQPPLVERVQPDGRERLVEALNGYAASLSADRRMLIEAYTVHDAAFRVVGVGSVGMRAYVILLMGAGPDDPLVLQAKEAVDSALAPFVPRYDAGHHGKRVTTGQRHLQSATDPFLGVTSVGGVDFYVRQLRDMKGAIDPEKLSATGLRDYGRLCGGLLAKAHARTADAAAIAAYCGNGTAFDESIAAFAVAYADQAERDHTALLAAIDDGRLEAVTGV
jgi:uncharacterized protein (DUF2252 family)